MILNVERVDLITNFLIWKRNLWSPSQTVSIYGAKVAKLIELTNVSLEASVPNVHGSSCFKLYENQLNTL